MKKNASFFLAFLLLLSLVGCEKESDAFQMNYEIPYASYEYDISYRYDFIAEGEPANISLYNVTSTAAHKTHGSPACGYAIVTDIMELEDFAAACEQNLRENYDDIYLFPGEEEDPYQSPFPYRYLGNTQETNFNEAFFASQDLLIVDLCGYGFLKMWSRPEEIQIEDGIARVQIRYGGRGSTTASNAGNLLLIPLPKGCSRAEVTVVLEKDWYESTSDVT